MTSALQPVGGSAGYIAVPVTTDPDDLASAAITNLATNLPGWVPRDSHLEVILIRAAARMVAEYATIAAQVPLSIFQYFGQTLLGLAPISGSAAGMVSTWTLIDAAGHTIPAGTTVAYPTSGDSAQLFAVSADTVVAPGTTIATGVPLIALELGTASNGLPGATLGIVDALAFVTQVVSTSTSSGGADPEGQTAYLDRLSAELQLLTPRPILASDYAALSRNQPYVGRATAIDGYNTADGSTGNARMVTVAAIDASGNALTPANQTALATYLASMREVNFVVNVASPTYTAVAISAQVTSVKGASTANVITAATAALNTFLSPAHWGDTVDSDGAWAGAWANTPTVRLLTVAALLAGVTGVSYVTGVQIGIGGAGLQPYDGQLPGAVPLPTPGSISIVVTPGT